MLAQVDPSLQNMSSTEKELWNSIIGRNVLARGLILDEKPGMLDQMVEATDPGQAGAPLDFGEDVIALARRM